MKTIEVDDEMYAELIELATEMTTQDPRATRMPHMFQIREKKKVYDWSLNGANKIWVDRSVSLEIEQLNDFINYLEQIGVTGVTNLEAAWESNHDFSKEGELEYNGKSYSLEDFITVHCEDLEECSYSWEDVYHNSFLTAKACKEHIRLNHYHYHEPVDYLNSAWRNPEAELVSSFLCSLVGKKMHT